MILGAYTRFVIQSMGSVIVFLGLPASIYVFRSKPIQMAAFSAIFIYSFLSAAFGLRRKKNTLFTLVDFALLLLTVGITFQLPPVAWDYVFACYLGFYYLLRVIEAFYWVNLARRLSELLHGLQDHSTLLSHILILSLSFACYGLIALIMTSVGLANDVFHESANHIEHTEGPSVLAFLSSHHGLKHLLYKPIVTAILGSTLTNLFIERCTIFETAFVYLVESLMYFLLIYDLAGKSKLKSPLSHIQLNRLIGSTASYLGGRTFFSISRYVIQSLLFTFMSKSSNTIEGLIQEYIYTPALGAKASGHPADDTDDDDHDRDAEDSVSNSWTNVLSAIKPHYKYMLFLNGFAHFLSAHTGETATFLLDEESLFSVILIFIPIFHAVSLAEHYFEDTDSF